MPSFIYKAVDQTGRPAHGRLEALSEVELEMRLSRMGLDLITCRAVAKPERLLNRSRVSAHDLMMLCFQLEQMLSAGVPLLTCLNDVRESASNDYFQKILGIVSTEVESGKLLSEAMGQHPKIFNEIFVSLIAAGEQTGQLPTVLSHLFNTIRWQNDLLSQTKKLLAYPAFIAVVVVFAVVFLMLYLVPQMVSFLENIGQELPLNTKILIAVSNMFSAFWWLLLGLPLLLIITCASFIQSNAMARYRYDWLTLNLPMLGPILHKIIMARFARYFALMYQTGIPVLNALKISETIVGNQVVREALVRVHIQINAGEVMSESFRNAGLFPQLVVRMINVGESTGRLDTALLKVSALYDRDVNDAIQNMLKLIEPALTLILGAMLAFIMFSVLGPVYDAFGKLAM